MVGSRLNFTHKSTDKKKPYVRQIWKKLLPTSNPEKEKKVREKPKRRKKEKGKRKKEKGKRKKEKEKEKGSERRPERRAGIFTHLAISYTEGKGTDSIDCYCMKFLNLGPVTTRTQRDTEHRGDGRWDRRNCAFLFFWRRYQP